MSTMTERPLENGWRADTPVGDTLLRRFVHNQGELVDRSSILAFCDQGNSRLSGLWRSS
jgi:hypothetical protein